MLVYWRLLFRDYDPATGRYLTPDPLGLKGGLDSYRYTPNPVDYVDPLGLDSEPVVTTKSAQKGQEVVLDDVPAPPASEIPETDGEWIGLKKNADEDLILCVGEEACADPSNVENAGWGDVAAWGAMLLVERVPVGRVLDKVPVPKGVKDKIGKDAGIEQVAQKKKMAPPPPAKKWTEKEVEGRKVYQRDDLFDPNRVDDFGKTNIERMKKGKAPIGKDGDEINLHHLTQDEPGSMAELGKNSIVKMIVCFIYILISTIRPGRRVQMVLGGGMIVHRLPWIEDLLILGKRGTGKQEQRTSRG